MLHVVHWTAARPTGALLRAGVHVDAYLPFVALPSLRALYRFVKVTNVDLGSSTHAIVLDVGPGEWTDDDYVFGQARPHSERVHQMARLEDLGAGIGISTPVRNLLQLSAGAAVCWEFVW